MSKLNALIIEMCQFKIFKIMLRKMLSKSFKSPWIFDSTKINTLCLSTTYFPNFRKSSVSDAQNKDFEGHKKQVF